MKIIIDIPEAAYLDAKYHSASLWSWLTDLEVQKSIRNGTPLPKGHGRLIDADLIAKQYGLNDATKYGNKNAKQQEFSYSTMMMYEIADMIDDAPTIIEADGGDVE